MSDNRIKIDLNQLRDGDANQMIKTAFEDLLSIYSQDRKRLPATIISYEKDDKHYHYQIGAKDSLYVLSLKSHKETINSVSMDDRHKAMLSLQSAISIISNAKDCQVDDSFYAEYIEHTILSLTAALEFFREQAKQQAQGGIK